MKKIVLYLLVSMMVLMSCSKEKTIDKHPEKFVGTWEMTSMSLIEFDYRASGYTSKGIIFSEQYEAGNAPVLILNADGTYEQTKEGETITGTWNVKERKKGDGFFTNFTFVRDDTKERADFRTLVTNMSNIDSDYFASDWMLDIESWISEPVDGSRTMKRYRYGKK